MFFLCAFAGNIISVIENDQRKGFPPERQRCKERKVKAKDKEINFSQL
jgi:hypothetical protein